jgi:hypothetical protein
MREIAARSVQPVAPTVLAAVIAEFGSCYTLADLLAWCARQVPRTEISEIVTQDEYTHDVVLPFVEETYLSFDTT